MNNERNLREDQPVAGELSSVDFRSESVVSDDFILKLVVVCVLLIAVALLILKRAPKSLLAFSATMDNELVIKVIGRRRISRNTTISVIDIKGGQYVLTETSSNSHSIVKLDDVGCANAATLVTQKGEEDVSS